MRDIVQSADFWKTSQFLVDMLRPVCQLITDIQTDNCNLAGTYLIEFRRWHMSHSQSPNSPVLALALAHCSCIIHHLPFTMLAPHTHRADVHYRLVVLDVMFDEALDEQPIAAGDDVACLHKAFTGRMQYGDNPVQYLAAMLDPRCVCACMRAYVCTCVKTCRVEMQVRRPVRIFFCVDT